MIKYFCNNCKNETTKKYATMHIVVNFEGREISRQYHVCPKCYKELMKMIRRDDMSAV